MDVFKTHTLKITHEFLGLIGEIDELKGEWQALVCENGPGYPTSKCGLGFLVDNESHGYAFYLKK